MSTVALYRDFDPRYRDFDLRPPVSAPRSTPAPAPRHVLRRILRRTVRRMLAAIERSQQRRVEQEAGRFIAEHGGQLTDDVERQLTERFNGGSFLRHAPPRLFRGFPIL